MIHESWEYYLKLNQFDPMKLYKNVIFEIGEDNFIKITKQFNKKILDNKINESIPLLENTIMEINNINDIETYYNIWNEFFKERSEYFNDSFKQSIINVIEYQKGNRPYIESYRSEKLI